MRVAIAHPDRLVREALRRTLASGGLQLLWCAADPAELARLRRRDPPELLLLDAGMVGPAADALRELSSACLVLASDDSAPGVFEALSAGALGHLPPPRLEANGELSGASRLLNRIQRLQALVRAAPAAAPVSRPPAPRGECPVVALGASTGGPQALACVLAGLPQGLPAAVLIVQHIDGEFSAGLCEWLGGHSLLPVHLAQRGELLQPGHVYVGANLGHLVLLPSQQLGYRTAQPGDLHVPGIDMLFASLAEHACGGAAALLSGMGSDGARGLLRLRQAGCHTIAQDETSSAVFGMPRAAQELGAAGQILPLAAIGPALARALPLRQRALQG